MNSGNIKNSKNEQTFFIENFADFEWTDISYIEDIKPKQENNNKFEVFKCDTGPDIDISKQVIELPIRHEKDNKKFKPLEIIL